VRTRIVDGLADAAAVSGLREYYNPHTGRGSARATSPGRRS
jgi:hypothetical protein